MYATPQGPGGAPSEGQPRPAQVPVSLPRHRDDARGEQQDESHGARHRLRTQLLQVSLQCARNETRSHALTAFGSLLSEKKVQKLLVFFVRLRRLFEEGMLRRLLKTHQNTSRL